MKFTLKPVEKKPKINYARRKPGVTNNRPPCGPYDTSGRHP